MKVVAEENSFRACRTEPGDGGCRRQNLITVCRKGDNRFNRLDHLRHAVDLGSVNKHRPGSEHIRTPLPNHLGELHPREFRIQGSCQGTVVQRKAKASIVRGLLRAHNGVR
ncbi:hypothetical protein D9M73_122630 [compost metagenome]